MIVTLKVLSTGEIAPIIRVKQHGVTDVRTLLLPCERQFLSAEEALASAIEYAREQIDTGLYKA